MYASVFTLSHMTKDGQTKAIQRSEGYVEIQNFCP